VAVRSRRTAMLVVAGDSSPGTTHTTVAGARQAVVGAHSAVAGVALRGCPARSWWLRLLARGELDGGTGKVVGQVMGGDDDGALGSEEGAGRQ
jgi:hypothetical protein